MHRVLYSIRTVAPSELPTITDIDGSTRPMTDAELLQIDVHHLHDDVYSCADQERRDPETLEWSVVGVQSPGVAITEGTLRQRHAQLPADVAPKVFRAQVIRSADPAAPAAVVAQANLTEAVAALAEYVGDVDGGPLLDLSGPAAVLEEAQRLVQIPDNGIDRHTVPMIAVDSGDVVEADRLIPHSWHGESTR